MLLSCFMQSGSSRTPPAHYSSRPFAFLLCALCVKLYKAVSIKKGTAVEVISVTLPGLPRNAAQAQNNNDKTEYKLHK